MLTALHTAGTHAIACVADALWTDALIKDLRANDKAAYEALNAFGPTGPHPLPPGSWKHEAHDDTLVIQPGLSFGDPDSSEQFGHVLAAQGTPALALQALAPTFRQAWDLDGLAASVEIPFDHFIGVAEGLASGLQIGTWTRQHHEVRFDPVRKRETWDAKATPAGNSFHVSMLPPLAPDPDYLLMTGEEPPQVGKALMSSPYWDAEWNAVSPPMDDLWPTPSDELAE
jgi:hypothetical protein